MGDVCFLLRNELDKHRQKTIAILGSYFIHAYLVVILHVVNSIIMLSCR